MKNRSQKTVCIILSLLLIAGISGCKWQSFDSVFRRGSSSSSGSRGGSGGTPLDINMIAITGATVTNEPMHESYGDVVYGGNNDEGPFLQQNLPVTVSSFRIAQTELTYTKWYEVYTWAVKHGYTFLYPGREGSRGMDGASPKGTGEPVTMISWRDAIVWCNAASEYEGLVYVYLNNAEVVKNACNSDADNCYISSAANGYRLPTSAEWEFAARGGSPTEIEWSYRYSGTDNQLELGSYAVYDLNDSIESNNTSPVKTKLPNSCGLYDMSGNVFEYCFDSCYGDSFTRIARGGRWCEGEWSASMECLRVESADWADWGFGFRVAQNVAVPPSRNLGLGMVTVLGRTVVYPPREISGVRYGVFKDVNNSDPGTYITVSSFMIGDTELLYAKWYEVLTWATQNGYSFANFGREGSNGTDGASPMATDIPVTYISWRDAVVWCNAASEYEGLTPVYKYSGSVLRDAEDTTVTEGSGKADLATIDSTANGYRLPTQIEWEFAARGGLPSEQSSDEWNNRYSGSYDNATLAAVCDTTQTTTAKTKQSNSLSLFDMGGNVAEWCWDQVSGSGPEERVCCGGSYNSLATNCYVHSASSDYVTSADTSYGFRVARNAN